MGALYRVIVKKVCGLEVGGGGDNEDTPLFKTRISGPYGPLKILAPAPLTPTKNVCPPLDAKIFVPP